MSGDKLDDAKYDQDVLLADDDRYTSTVTTDVAAMERGFAHTAGGELCDPAIDTRATQLGQDPAELAATIGRLVGTTSATEELKG